MIFPGMYVGENKSAAHFFSDIKVVKDFLIKQLQLLLYFQVDLDKLHQNEGFYKGFLS